MFICAFDQPGSQLLVQKYGMPVHNFIRKGPRLTSHLKAKLFNVFFFVFVFFLGGGFTKKMFEFKSIQTPHFSTKIFSRSA